MFYMISLTFLTFQITVTQTPIHRKNSAESYLFIYINKHNLPEQHYMLMHCRISEKTSDSSFLSLQKKPPRNLNYMTILPL